MAWNIPNMNITQHSNLKSVNMTNEADVYDALRYRVTVDQSGTRRYRDAKGRYHREGGPAIELASGERGWFKNGKRHRVDGPALEEYDGSRHWYQNGERHRNDGPAIEWSDGSRQWFLYGREYTEAKFLARLEVLVFSK